MNLLETRPVIVHLVQSRLGERWNNPRSVEACLTSCIVSQVRVHPVDLLLRSPVANEWARIVLVLDFAIRVVENARFVEKPVVVRSLY